MQGQGIETGAVEKMKQSVLGVYSDTAASIMFYSLNQIMPHIF